MGRGKGRAFSNWNKDPFNISAFENNAAYTEYFLKLMDIAINRFKWNGLPDTVDERYLEMMLVQQGSAIFFYDEIFGYMGLGTAYQGNLDYYGVPEERQAIAANGDPFKTMDSTNSVLIFNNRLRTADSPLLYIYANRLWEIQREIETNTKQQKFTQVVICDEEERISMSNLMMKWQGNQPLVFGKKGINMDAFQTLNFNTPFVAEQLYNIKNSIYNEALTSLGIFNASNTNKRERLVSTEASSMNGAIERTRQSYLNARQQAAEQINRLFGLNVSVEFETDIPLSLDKPDETEGEEE